MNDGDTVRTWHLPLGRIALCLDCETCFEIGTDPWPACGSGTWASVARFLYRRGDFPRATSPLRPWRFSMRRVTSCGS